MKSPAILNLNTLEMEEINIKQLCESITKVVPKAPITCLDSKTMIFRGNKLEVNGCTAKARTFEFRFNSLGTFVESLREFGLMLNYREIEMIIKFYRNGKTNFNEK